MVKQGIETVKTLWRKEKDKLRVLLAYCTTPLERVARPDELMMGRKIRKDILCMNRRHNEEIDFRQWDTTLKERQQGDYNRCHRTEPMLELEEGAFVWVKIDHKDRGKPGTVRFKVEELASTKVTGRLVKKVAVSK